MYVILLLSCLSLVAVFSNNPQEHSVLSMLQMVPFAYPSCIATASIFSSVAVLFVVAFCISSTNCLRSLLVKVTTILVYLLSERLLLPPLKNVCFLV